MVSLDGFSGSFQRDAMSSWVRCLSSLGCPELSLDAIIALAEKHDVPGIELRALGGTIDLAAYFAAEFGTPERLAARMKASRVRIAGFNASLHLAGATDAERAQLLGLVPWAEAVGARRLRVFDGGKHADAAELAEMAATLQWWRAQRQRGGWTTDVMVETHDSLLTAAAIGRFLARVPDAPILWDAHHTWRKGGEDPAATWRAIRRAVVHVHVKDSIAVPSARHPFTYVLPGDGGFPMTALRAALQADAFAGRLSFEWEKLWHPYLPSLDEALTVAAGRNWW